jgi:SAM-dependent methyltransferase
MQGGARAIGTVAEPRADSVGADPAPRDAPRRVRWSWNHSSSPIWLDPDLYDIENPEDPPFDLAFWDRMVREVAPRRMLELAAGTGRLTIPLARLGIAEEIVALDLSEPFLGRLREKLAAEDDPCGAR